VNRISGTACMKFVKRDFKAAINVRRCLVLKTRPTELNRENFLRRQLRLEVCAEKLKPIAGGRSKKQADLCEWMRVYNLRDRELLFFLPTIDKIR